MTKIYFMSLSAIYGESRDYVISSKIGWKADSIPAGCAGRVYQIIGNAMNRSGYAWQWGDEYGVVETSHPRPREIAEKLEGYRTTWGERILVARLNDWRDNSR